MADALVSPAVGGAMWAVTGGLGAYCVRRLRGNLDERRVPLMGVLGAFVFAVQMINVAIPGTGSSGHLGGGLLLAILLGPHAAFITIVSVLTVQALFFADGGLLALGCNAVNVGLFPCFAAYLLVYKRVVGRRPSRGRMLAGTLAASIVGLQLGALGVVLETVFSGVAELSFDAFVLFMLPIHLPIGVLEGVVTAGVVTFVLKARPEILDTMGGSESRAMVPLRNVVAGIAVAAVVTGGVLSWYASDRPDGLEWSVLKASGTGSDSEEPEPEGAPDSQGRVGTSVSGLVGAGLTLALVGAVALGFRWRPGGGP